jgi:hypothetical protein
MLLSPNLKYGLIRIGKKLNDFYSNFNPGFQAGVKNFMKFKALAMIC